VLVAGVWTSRLRWHRARAAHRDAAGITSGVGVIASIICALMIDKVARKPWYSAAFLLAVIPLVVLTTLGATSAVRVVVLATIAYDILQTISFSLYLYSAELCPTRLRCVGTGFGSAWLRAGSAAGPILVGFIVGDFGIRYVFSAFAAVALIGGIVTLLCAIETKGSARGAVAVGILSLHAIPAQ
jgi:putative MFS transporter